MAKDIIIFTDCGDTIVDEGTQVFAENRDVLLADPIPGADRVLKDLHAKGYRIALVADGRVASFRNILTRLGLYDLFESRSISEALGVAKPDPLMFEYAMREMGLTAEDAPRIVMIGNNIKRDVVGANRMGMVSILIDYSPRYDMRPTSDEETPDFTVTMPDEIPPILERLDAEWKAGH